MGFSGIVYVDLPTADGCEILHHQNDGTLQTMG